MTESTAFSLSESHGRPEPPSHDLEVTLAMNRMSMADKTQRSSRKTVTTPSMFHSVGQIQTLKDTCNTVTEFNNSAANPSTPCLRKSSMSYQLDTPSIGTRMNTPAFLQN